MVEAAYKFLSTPKVRDSPWEEQRGFLLGKGVTEQEIEEAKQRLPVLPAQNIAMQQYPPPYQPNKVRQFVESAAILSTAAYAGYHLLRTYVLPRFNIPDPATEEVRQLQQQINELQNSMKFVIDSVSQQTQTLAMHQDEVSKALLMVGVRQNEMERVENGISTIRSLLLSHNQFAPVRVPAMTTTSSVPSWQREPPINFAKPKNDAAEEEKENEIPKADDEADEFQDLERSSPVNWQMAKDFDDYEKCVAARKDETRVTAEVLLVRQGAAALLNCYRCLYPEDELFIRQVFKPGKSHGEKIFHNFLTHIRTFVLGANTNLNQWKNDWFFLANGDHMWTEITQNFKMKGISELLNNKFFKKAFGLASRAKYHQGDGYELRIDNASRTDIGFYKCARTPGMSEIATSGNIESLTFLDVYTNRESKIQDFLDKENITKTKEEIAMEAEFDGVRTFAKATPWSRCNRCGAVIGEMVRTVECHVMPVTLSNLSSGWEHLRLFNSVPCASSLVPLRHRKEIGRHPILYQFRSCHIHCDSKEHATRVFRSRDQFGKASYVERIPGGEFIFGELLPRLHRQVVREIVEPFNGDQLVLPCKFDNDLMGYYWAGNYSGPLTARVLPQKKNDRIFIDGDFNLVFKEVLYEDEDEYICVDGNGELVAFYHLNIRKTQFELEMIKISQMVIQVFTLLFVVALILDLAS
ncbi:unnamed protein product, partial [Mesorhabditis spiculigera]